TIHGLCASILRANAAAAGVDPAFAVLDEVEARVLLDTVIDDVLRRIEPGDPVLVLFSEYGGRNVREALYSYNPLPLPDGDLFALWAGQWREHAEAALTDFVDFCAASPISQPFDPPADKLGDVWLLARNLVDQ